MYLGHLTSRSGCLFSCAQKWWANTQNVMAQLLSKVFCLSRVKNQDEIGERRSRCPIWEQLRLWIGTAPTCTSCQQQQQQLQFSPNESGQKALPLLQRIFTIWSQWRAMYSFDFTTMLCVLAFAQLPWQVNLQLITAFNKYAGYHRIVRKYMWHSSNLRMFQDSCKIFLCILDPTHCTGRLPTLATTQWFSSFSPCPQSSNLIWNLFCSKMRAQLK